MELNDAEVIARAVNEPAQFVAVFDRHGPAVHAYLARRLGTQGADDVFTEVWLQALQSLRTYDPRRPDARPWLYGIAHNVLRTHWAKEARRRGRRPPGSRASDLWGDVNEQLDAQLWHADLLAAVQSLPASDREVLLLVAWEGLTPLEVAQVLDIPGGTARWRLHRARTAVQRQLGERPTRQVRLHDNKGSVTWTS